MKYSYDRTAASQMLDDSDIKKLKKLTEANHASEAYILGCKLIGAKHLMKKFELIQQLEKLEGHLPSDLSKYRYDVYQEMMKAAKQELDADDYKAFYGSF